MTGRWLSRPAVLWALYDAEDVPAHLVAELIVVAAHAGEDGRGAYPSAAVVAAATRKTERAAKRDLAELRERGLLLPGAAPPAVKKIRADRRPNVYDLPMPRGDAAATPHTAPRGDAQGRTGWRTGSHGVAQASPEESLNRPRTIPARAREPTGAVADGTDPIEQIIEAFKTCTGKTVSRGWAEHTRTHVLERANGHISDETRYVIGAIKREGRDLLWHPQYGDPYANRGEP
jgi:hypothetical protein